MRVRGGMSKLARIDQCISLYFRSRSIRITNGRGTNGHQEIHDLKIRMQGKINISLFFEMTQHPTRRKLPNQHQAGQEFQFYLFILLFYRELRTKEPKGPKNRCHSPHYIIFHYYCSRRPLKALNIRFSRVERVQAYTHRVRERIPTIIIIVGWEENQQNAAFRAFGCSHSSMSQFRVGKGNQRKGSLVNNHDHGNICSLSRYPRIYQSSPLSW